MILEPKEPWYVATSTSSTPKIVTHWIARLVLAVGLGSCLVPWKTDPIGFVTGVFSIGLLLFLTYHKGMNDGAIVMYSYMTTRARDALNAMSLMEDVLRKNRGDNA